MTASTSTPRAGLSTPGRVCPHGGMLTSRRACKGVAIPATYHDKRGAHTIRRRSHSIVGLKRPGFSGSSRAKEVLQSRIHRAAQVSVTRESIPHAAQIRDDNQAVLFERPAGIPGNEAAQAVKTKRWPSIQLAKLPETADAVGIGSGHDVEAVPREPVQRPKFRRVGAIGSELFIPRFRRIGDFRLGGVGSLLCAA